MSIVTANILRPFPGKRGVAEERFKKMASVFERLGATVKRQILLRVNILSVLV